MTAIAVSIEDVGEIERVREGIANYIYAHTSGAQVSDVTVGCVVDECRTYAQSRGLTLIDAARAMCRLTSEHLHGYDGDAGTALTTVDHSIGIDGVTLLVLIIAQKRTHTKEDV